MSRRHQLVSNKHHRSTHHRQGNPYRYESHRYQRNYSDEELQYELQPVRMMPFTRCSVCQKPGMTKTCTCRQHLLKNIPRKDHCDKLRLEGSPAQLIFDIQIATDVIPVVVDTKSSVSIVNKDMVRYLRRLQIVPENDNTITFTFRSGDDSDKFTVNCVIREDEPCLISIGLTMVLNLGMEFLYKDSNVRGIQHNPGRSLYKPQDRHRHIHGRAPYKYQGRPQNRHYTARTNSYNDNRRHFEEPAAPRRNYDPVVISYPPVASSVNWDEDPQPQVDQCEGISEEPINVVEELHVDILNTNESVQHSTNENVSNSHQIQNNNPEVSQRETSQSSVNSSETPVPLNDSPEHGSNAADSESINGYVAFGLNSPLIDLQPQVHSEALVPERDVDRVLRNLANINMETDEDTLLLTDN